VPKTTLREQTLQDFDRLSPDLQERARDLVHGLTSPRPKGATVDDLHPLVGLLDEDSAREMWDAIAEGDERADGRGTRDEG
jgi:hypothetical protein